MKIALKRASYERFNAYCPAVIWCGTFLERVRSPTDFPLTCKVNLRDRAKSKSEAEVSSTCNDQRTISPSNKSFPSIFREGAISLYELTKQQSDER